ncbi:MAG: tetratricopeptide repeat protein, partial [Vicinamibacteria bacterium]
SDPRRLASLLADLDLGDAVNRFALLYALQESGREIAESPIRALRFAEEVLARLRREPSGSDDGQPDAERIVPRLALLGQAHVLAGQACNWTSEYERAKAHFEVAYRSFARAGCDEVSFAIVEYHESQRRSFIGRGLEGLVLARRAVATFEALELEDLYARAKATEGLALSKLGRPEDAIAAYRVALPVFVRGGLWSNYVGTLNSIGTALHRLGRLDEARREYARALRCVSRERHRSFLAFIRHGLADVLFSAGHYREAALSLAQASRLYYECGLAASALKASLFEIESWARAGDVGRALRRLGVFRADVARHRALDLSIARQIEVALSGQDPDFQRVAELRLQAEGALGERLGEIPA